MMAKWEIDGPLRGPAFYGVENADWHVDFIKRNKSTIPSCMTVYFSSININEAEANEIVSNILFGLNSVKVNSK